MTGILVENGRIFTREGWSAPGYCLTAGEIIAAIGEGDAPEEFRKNASEVLDARGMAVLPGFTNAHTHLSQTFMRGLSGGRTLMQWLKELIWPMQAAMSLEELELAALLGLVENLRSGCTRVTDHQKITRTPDYSHAVCNAARRVGLRLTMARAWTDRGTNAEPADAILGELAALFQEYGKDPLVKIASGPLTPWRASEETLRRTHEMAGGYGSFTHIHVSEANDEVLLTVKESGLRPVSWLESVGVLDEATQVVHAVWVDAGEIEALARRGATVIHCPAANAVLGSGMAPVGDMHRAGIEVRLGTDGPASNDSQDQFESMKLALCISRLRTLDPTDFGPRDVLEMAVSGQVLEEGADADLVLVDLQKVNCAPVQDLDSALALSCRAGNVDSVVCAGKVLLRHGVVACLDEDALLRECGRAVTGLRRKAGLDLN